MGVPKYIAPNNPIEVGSVNAVWQGLVWEWVTRDGRTVKDLSKLENKTKN